MRGFFGIGVQNISKEQNVGTIARSAHSFGASFFFTIAPEVDVEAIEHVLLAGLATSMARRCLLLVALDVDAPIGAFTSAQHARGAVLLVERDHATGARRRLFLLVRVLHGVGAA